MNHGYEKNVKLCLFCEEKIIGRSDKKFCCDQCRTSHFNRIHAHESSAMKSINAVLKKNRRILEHFNQIKSGKLVRSELIRSGFNFSYYTHERISKSGKTYKYCYDYGYLEYDVANIKIIHEKRLLPIF